MSGFSDHAWLFHVVLIIGVDSVRADVRNVCYGGSKSFFDFYYLRDLLILF